jgi:hypothetical protein
MSEKRSLTWFQVRHGGRLLRQWSTEETDENGTPVAYIIEVASYMGYDTKGPHYNLAMGGERLVFASLQDAKREASDPGSVEPLKMREP